MAYFPVFGKASRITILLNHPTLNNVCSSNGFFNLQCQALRFLKQAQAKSLKGEICFVYGTVSQTVDREQL
jgi:hypothetical protein